MHRSSRSAGSRTLLPVLLASAGLLLPAHLHPAAAAPPAPFNVTGHWTGSYRSPRNSGRLTADFTAGTNPESFTGTFTVLSADGQQVKNTFSAQGTLSRTGKVSVLLTSTDPSQGGSATVTGVLNRRTGSIRGTYRVPGPGSSTKDHGSFTLVKQ